MAAIDVVYTWVDDTWPGYHALLTRCARDRHDLNPNRYRDNVDILKYNLRALDRYAPWIDRVFLVTCRPQVPRWLDTTMIRVVHHDQIMDPADLPTFNSFAIVANLHRIPDLSARFPAEHACRVRLHLASGETLAAEKSDYEGFRTRPMSWQRAKDKFDRLVAGLHKAHKLLGP